MMNVKAVILGSMAVGKTAICNRYQFNEFQQAYQVTIGAGYYEKEIDLHGKTINMQLWDTAGMEKHQSLNPIYFRNAKVAIFVYDLSEENSFYSLDGYLQKFKEFNSDSFYGVVVGNKSDLNYSEKSKGLGSIWAEQNKMDFVITSAKTGEGINDIFSYILKNISVIDNVSECGNNQTINHECCYII